MIMLRSLNFRNYLLDYENPHVLEDLLGSTCEWWN